MEIERASHTDSSRYFYPSIPVVTLYEEFLCIHCSPRRMHESLSPHSQNDDPPLSADDNIHIIFF